MNNDCYSPLFHTLHDETSPVGRLGRGTHYTVLSAVQWVNNNRRLLPQPDIQRFAVIWDEDHDTRVIRVIEAAYMRGIFAPVLYIGERKAFLTVVVNDDFYDIIQLDIVSYTMAWKEIISNETHDFWEFRLVRLSEAADEMIMADKNKVSTYLHNINNLWQLGRNKYQPTVTETDQPLPLPPQFLTNKQA